MGISVHNCKEVENRPEEKDECKAVQKSSKEGVVSAVNQGGINFKAGISVDKYEEVKKSSEGGDACKAIQKSSEESVVSALKKDDINAKE